MTLRGPFQAEPAKKQVLESLRSGPKMPHEIEKDIRQTILRRYKSVIQNRQTSAEKKIRENVPSVRTIHTVLAALRVEGKVMNRNHRYSLTKRAITDPSVAGSILAGAMDLHLIGGSSWFYRTDDLKEYLANSAYTLGAYIMYLFLQSMNPDGPIKTTLKRGQRGYSKERDESVLEWIKAALPIPTLFWHFRFWSGLPSHEDWYRGASREPYFELDRSSFERAMSQYGMLFPRLYTELEKARIAAPDRLDRRNRMVERVYRENEKKKASMLRSGRSPSR